MHERNPHGLELHWVEVRDEHGTHLEARWSQAAVAAPVAAETHTPHAA